MGTKSAAALLTSVDSMFTTQEERDNAQRSYVTDLPTAEISDFPDHPFKVRMDESMTELADSVKERGVLSPVLVRPMPDGSYQMVAGHRRKMAAELAGLPTVPCIVRELSDDEAVIIMVDSNLSAPVRFCSFSPNRECRKMAGKHVQPLNNYTCRFRPSSPRQADKSGLDGLQADK